MTEPAATNLPAQIADAIAGVPKALVPACVKALDRLVGAAVDIPVAWLNQHKAKLEAQTKAYEVVEAAIGTAAAGEASADRAIIGRAVDVLVRKEYRRQINKEAVGVAALEDLRSEDAAQTQRSSSAPPTPAPDDDWLNVFERYAEDASSERMQKLWGRVLAGEVRKAGQFSIRTLRFLSEFSQADALSFSSFCTHSFGDSAPNALVNPDGITDIRPLLDLEDAGLIKGVNGIGLRRKHSFDKSGQSLIVEGSLIIALNGEPGSKFDYGATLITQLGQELVALLPGRDAKLAARAFADAIKSPQITSATLLGLDRASSRFVPIEIFWQEEAPLVQPSSA